MDDYIAMDTPVQQLQQDLTEKGLADVYKVLVDSGANDYELCSELNDEFWEILQRMHTNILETRFIVARKFIERRVRQMNDQFASSHPVAIAVVSANSLHQTPDVVPAVLASQTIEMHTTQSNQVPDQQIHLSPSNEIYATAPPMSLVEHQSNVSTNVPGKSIFQTAPPNISIAGHSPEISSFDIYFRSPLSENEYSPVSNGFSNESVNDSDSEGTGNCEQKLELQADISDFYNSARIYEVTCHEEMLGMFLEKKCVQSTEADTTSDQEATVVKLLVEGSPAQQQGVQVGSRLLSVNGIDCNGVQFTEIMNIIKTTPRPLLLRLESPVMKLPDTTQGWCFYKSSSLGAPRQFNAWKKRYFVLGGAVSKPEILQVYLSKRDYESVVSRIFRGMQVIEKVQTWKLSNKSKISKICSKKYSGDYILSYFCFKAENNQLKYVYLANENAADIESLYNHVKYVLS